MINFSVSCAGVNFPNPLVLASGILGVTSASFSHSVSKGCGGITTKSLWHKKHPGHPNPTMFGNEHYMLNAVGLSDAGVEKSLTELSNYIPQREVPLIANIVGGSMDEFVRILEFVETLEYQPDIIEMNISCPNVEDEFGKPFACDLISATEVTEKARKKTKLPLFIKLSPNVPNIGEIAKSVENAGADGITAINTLGPGMRWNIDLRQPLLSNTVGGVSGPAIFPLAVKTVFDIYKAVKIPIIATGGVTSGRDALEIMMAGGTLVGVGTALYYQGDEFWENAKIEMSTWLQENKIKNISDIIGAFHKV